MYSVDKGRRKKIESVVFVGNNKFSGDELQEHVNVQTAGLLGKANTTIAA
jgi:outer membrane protein assembly factor BamA